MKGIPSKKQLESLLPAAFIATFLAGTIYTGMIIGSNIERFKEYKDGLRESGNFNNQPEVRQAAQEYAYKNLNPIKSPQFFNAFKQERKPYEETYRLRSPYQAQKL